MSRQNIAHGTFANLLNPSHDVPRSAHLRTRDYGQSFGFGELGCIDDVSHSNWIDSDRLFDEDVLACLDRCLEVEGSENGRSGEDDKIDVAGDDLLVSVEA